MRNKKFVLDANIWVSYFISNNLLVLISAISINKITIFYCTELLIEIERVLNYPHLKKREINIKKALKFIQDIGTQSELIYPIKNYIPEDSDDSYVIALALQQNAGSVTSGDKHILSQKDILENKFKKLKIITKAEFERLFYE
jgi:uncharacterized protein